MLSDSVTPRTALNLTQEKYCAIPTSCSGWRTVVHRTGSGPSGARCATGDSGWRRAAAPILVRDLSYFLAFVGFSAADHPARVRPLRRREAAGMRVERFSLFFPPHVSSAARGDGVRHRDDPARRLRADQRHEPARGDARGGRDRAYSAMPVWKRVVVIAAGPGMNILIALRDLLGDLPDRRHGAAPRASTRSSGLAEAACCTPATSSSRSTVCRQPASSPSRSRTHRCAGAPGRRLPRNEPARVVVRRNGELVTLRARRATTPRRSARGWDSASTSTSARTARCGADDESVSKMWRVTHPTADAITRIYYDPQARKEVSGASAPTR